jgi:hypothetical protein
MCGQFSLCTTSIICILILSIFLLLFQNYNNMEFGIVRLIGIFVVGKLMLNHSVVIMDGLWIIN